MLAHMILHLDHVTRPNDRIIIRTKWVFRNKYYEIGKVICNKARLVEKGDNFYFDVSEASSELTEARPKLETAILFLFHSIRQFHEPT